MVEDRPGEKKRALSSTVINDVVFMFNMDRESQ